MPTKLSPLQNNGAAGTVQIQTYTQANVLAANVAENITVPTSDDTGIKAGYVTFGKAAAADFYAQVFDAVTGADKVINGTFAEYVTNGAFASDTGWTKGTGWTIAAGVATATGAISTALSQTSAITLIAGYSYTITYTVTAFTAGTITPSIGGTAGVARSSAATFTEVIVAGSTQILAFTGAGFTGSIDNVSVTAWALGTGWTTDGTTAIATGGISTAISQLTDPTSLLVSGQTYLVTFVLTRSAGSIAVSLGGGTAGTSRSSSATFTEVITAGSTQSISFATTAFTGTLDTVTVVGCAGVPIDNTTGLVAQQNPSGFILPSNALHVSIVSAGAPTITSSFYKR